MLFAKILDLFPTPVPLSNMANPFTLLYVGTPCTTWSTDQRSRIAIEKCRLEAEERRCRKAKTEAPGPDRLGGPARLATACEETCHSHLP